MAITPSENMLAPERAAALLEMIESRFLHNKQRHPGIEWQNIELKLQGNLSALWSLNEMEISGGEPDVLEYLPDTGEYLFVDCSVESPVGRRSLCYDQDALDSRKSNKPEGSASDMALSMGTELLSEEQYRKLQKTGAYDLKTSSWIKTPPEVRNLGGALFADRRYNRVFVYHNGAESYFGSRGFRACCRV